MAKLHNLPLEAPITKVITLLTTALAETVSPDTSAQIDKVCRNISKHKRVKKIERYFITENYCFCFIKYKFTLNQYYSFKN